MKLLTRKRGRFVKHPSVVLPLVALFFLIAGVAALQGYKQFQNSLEEDRLADRNAARMTAMVVQNHEETTLKILESYASRRLLIGSVQDGDIVAIQKHLADLKKNNEEVDLAFVTDEQGLLLAEYPVFPEVIGRDLSFRDWYRGVSSRWRPYISSAFRLIVADRSLAVAAAVPIFETGGEVVGILANSYRLAALDRLFNSLHGDMEISIYLVDQAGQVIYDSRHPKISQTTPYRFYPEIKMAAAEENSLEVDDGEGGRGKTFLAVVPTDIGWTVVAERSLGTTIRSEYRHLFRIAGIAVLLFLLLAVFILYQNSLHRKTLALLQMERQLKQSEKRYEDLIDNLPDILYSFSDIQAGGYFSPQVESVLGYSDEHLRTRPTLWHDSIHPDDLPEVHRAIMAAKNGEKVELVYRIYDIHGQCHWFTDRMTGKTGESGETLVTGIARDITDHKTSEEALGKSRKRYRTLIENMLDGFAYCQMLYDDRGTPIDFLYLEVNDAFTRLTGLKDVIGRKFSEIFHGTYAGRQELLERYSRVATTGIPEKFEFYFVPLSQWLDISVASHEWGYILVVFNDITERKVLTEQRQAALDLLQNIADRVPGVVFQCRLDDRGTFSFPFISQGVREIYRLSPEEVRNEATVFFAAHHPADQVGVLETLHKSGREGGPWAYKYRLKLADGTERWLSGSAIPQRAEDGSILWHGVITDITERKQVEDALRESEARFSTAARVARFGVYSYDFTDGQTYYSRECLSLFGMPPDRQPELDEDLVPTVLHPADKPDFLERMLAALDPSGPGTLEHEYRIIRADGQVRWLRMIGKTVFSGNRSDDRPLRANGIVQDITERRQAEEQLRTLNDELERRVEQRTHELQETHSHFLHIEKLSAIGKLSASIAHEFNSPLQAVMTVLKGLQLGTRLDDGDRKLLEAAFGESERMKSLIRSLQDFNRPSSGRKVPMDVHASIDSLLLLYKSDFNRRNITIELHYSERFPQIMAIPDQIKQIFLNLLNNAADACLDNGGVISISTWQEDERVAVAIRDTGVGIPPDKMDLIFQPFYTTKPEIKGTGLGLSVCHGIVRNHRGEIRVESLPGQGSTFTVLLPIHE